jgi:hypothetical protein
VLYAKSGRELPDIFGRTTVDTLQDIDEVVVRMVLLEAAGAKLYKLSTNSAAISVEESSRFRRPIAVRRMALLK